MLSLRLFSSRFQSEQGFLFFFFFECGQNILKLFLVYLVYIIYICTYETQLGKIHNLDKHRSWLLL